MVVKLYTSPHCPRCEALKEALRELGVSYEELDVSDTNVMASLIMRDVYLASTPALEVEGRLLSSEALFRDGEVDRELLRRAVGKYER
ncbi:MAG: glutaredoxin family protein [Candidatus Nezhaarchaeota archaeon]|nr:glutaredoxin family protein [Candidatus Nezhaarchaeota archaeon]